MSQQASPLPSPPDAAVAQPCSAPGHGGNGRHGGAATSIAVGDRPNDSGARPPPPPEAGKLRREQRADGPACVLAAGTANPANCIPQDEFADWYFRVTKSDHLTHLKDAMKKACEQVGVKKRHFQVTEDLLRAHPEILDPALPSIDARLHAVAAALPELAAAAAAKAIADWGRPAGDITHLVVSTSSGAQMPGIDVRVASLLGLRPTVRRTMIYFQACTGGAGALRVAKDAAENNRGARVLAVCADVLSAMAFHAPDEARPEGPAAHAIFGDGAGAVVVGADPRAADERPVFQMVSASQATIPGTELLVTGDFGAAGVEYNLATPEVPVLVAENIEGVLAAAVAPLGLASGGWNSLFWVVHPGSHLIMNSYEKVLRLEPGKLAVSRRVLTEYGNMIGPTVIFVLDEVVRRRRLDGEGEGKGCEWGLLVGLGPGFTAEVIVLRACK
ncbi:hypothetical protein PAHAL_8G194500 [Panicum hallii]|uniref:Chalcone/stilbene synthase N-terminal domain-containing protein n=1 Tax=Panicum hallii TaxID=206008 RepID=A0A2S3IEI0_9POAL|nr:bisdemethoxycurcumin synthase-like [Panicum hallii]PAN42879.1 hypothetical protein PAHAL_8G194500 [Panicum hallii]